MMVGVSRNGVPVILFPLQATMVRMLLGDEPADERLVEFFNRGTGAGKSTVLASAVHIERCRYTDMMDHPHPEPVKDVQP